MLITVFLSIVVYKIAVIYCVLHGALSGLPMLGNRFLSKLYVALATVCVAEYRTDLALRNLKKATA